MARLRLAVWVFVSLLLAAPMAPAQDYPARTVTSSIRSRPAAASIRWRG